MKAFFKDNNKIIINSMDFTETIIGKQFLEDLKGKLLVAEQRNDINDDFDGLVLSIGGDIPTEEEIQARIDAAVEQALSEARASMVTLDANVNSNGDTEFLPSEEQFGFAGVNIHTNVPVPTIQEDSPKYTVSENGTYEFESNDGSDVVRSVKVTVEVPQNN